MNIEPEIKDDELYHAIVELVKEKKPRNILEIGSSNGLGSTQAFIEGIRALPHEHRCTLYCLEADPQRFAELELNMKNVHFAECYNASSVPVSEYINEDEIATFLKNRPYGTFNIVRYGVSTVCGWRKAELETIVAYGVKQNGIEWAKKRIGGMDFDMVLIDGSAFTGWAEYQKVDGAKILILDDTMDIKNFCTVTDILVKGNYNVIGDNRKYRNGYAIFERKV